MLVTNHDFDAAKAAARADARAFSGRLAPSTFTPTGVAWLTEIVEGTPCGAIHMAVLGAERAAELVETAARIDLPYRVHVTIWRDTPRRGRVQLKAIVELAPALVRRPARRRTEYQAARHDLAAE